MLKKCINLVGTDGVYDILPLRPLKFLASFPSPDRGSINSNTVLNLDEKIRT